MVSPSRGERNIALGPQDRRIGVIGYGAVGRSVAQLIQEGSAGSTVIVAVLVRDRKKLLAALPSPRFQVHDSLNAFLNDDLELVVEAAGHDALRAYARDVIDAGKDLMVVSTGAFADAEFLGDLTRRAGHRACQIRT